MKKLTIALLASASALILGLAPDADAGKRGGKGRDYGGYGHPHSDHHKGKGHGHHGKPGKPGKGKPGKGKPGKPSKPGKDKPSPSAPTAPSAPAAPSAPSTPAPTFDYESGTDGGFVATCERGADVPVGLRCWIFGN